MVRYEPVVVFLSLFDQKLRDAGLEVPEGGKKGMGPQEENKNLKEEVKTLKEELDSSKKGEVREQTNLSVNKHTCLSRALIGCCCRRVSALQKSDSDVRAMKKQAENLTVEYDRLLEEHSKLLVTISPKQPKQQMIRLYGSSLGSKLNHKTVKFVLQPQI